MKSYIINILSIVERIIRFLSNKVKVYAYSRSLSSRVNVLKGKNNITVLFIVPCLAKWKTEFLFCEMMKHPRFNPILALTTSPSDYPTESLEKISSLIAYCNEKGYSYIEIPQVNIPNNIQADLVFFNEASCAGDFWNNFPNSVFCYIGYCFETVMEKGLFNSPYQNSCWKYFVENNFLIEDARKLMDNHANNMVATGLPISDYLQYNSDAFIDPWKRQNTTINKKRIIWAPHHSIETDGEGLHFSSFLLIADAMITIANKYKNVLQIAFKPHPTLKTKLYALWGKEKTDAYYDTWKSMPNTQIENGEYLGLFKHSDALIHDSASFIVEYLYMRKPCMFVSNGIYHQLNTFSSMCYEQYYIGKNIDDIENFINNVLTGVDEKASQRSDFYNSVLVPNTQKTSSTSIIENILESIV